MNVNTKIQPESSWNLSPTPKQIRAITLLCIRLGIREYLEEKPSSRYEARQLIYDLIGRKGRASSERK